MTLLRGYSLLTAYFPQPYRLLSDQNRMDSLPLSLSGSRVENDASFC